MKLPRLHLVTDDELLGRTSFVETASAVLRAGGASLALHLRGPRSSGRRMYELARSLGSVARDAGALLAVNDRIDVVLAAGLGAVHLGERSLDVLDTRRLVGPELLIGRSTHDLETTEAASRDGADFLFFGTVFSTPSHPGRDGAGTSALSRAVVSAGDVPLLAIGGISRERIPQVRTSGAYGVAVMRGIWHAADPALATTMYISGLER
ncbi:MAG: thiamine phosphate synthase [Longimicrobiales bacterium]|nr:thiamine phosphate synthase [Longimicrobiales bacterium]